MGRQLLGLMSLLVMWLAATPAGAVTFQASTLFNANDRSVWGNSPAFVVDTGPKFVGIDWDEGARAGGVECALFACFGAEIGANTMGRLGFDYGVKLNSGSFDLQLPGVASFTVPDSRSGTLIGAITIGSGYSSRASFALPTTNGFDSRAATLQVSGPTASAYLDLAAQFDAFAGARVCVGVCYGPALGPIGFDESRTIAAINRDGDQKITVLGETVSARQDVTALGGLLRANLQVPNLDGSSAATPGGYSATQLLSVKRDHLATVTGNLSQIAANGAGLPIPLAGKLGPIGYNLLQSGAGLSIDVQQTLTFVPKVMGRYVFSSDVIPLVNGVQGAPTNFIDFQFGDDVTFLPGQVGNISYQPYIYLGGTVTNSIDLIFAGTLDVTALGLNVGGASLGPLVDERLSGDIASLQIYTTSFSGVFGEIAAFPISLDFVNCRGDRSGSNEFPVFGICASSGYSEFIRGPLEDGLYFGELSLLSCSSAPAGGQIRCFGIDPIGFSSSFYFSEFGERFYVNSSDYRSFVPISPGASTTSADQLALIARLGGAPMGSFVIPEGTPLSGFVPEPGIWGMMVAGFLLVGATIRRRRPEAG